MARAQRTIKLKNSFGRSVSIFPEQFSHFIVWTDSGHINFWNDKGGGCVGTLDCTPDTVIPDAEQVFLRLKSTGMPLIRVNGGADPVSGRNNQCLVFVKPETVEYFEDDENPGEHGPALTLLQMPLFMTEDERVDVKDALKRATPANDWLEFSPDLTGVFNSARGHYGFRKSMITDMFAVPEKSHMAIQTHDRYRSFVPMQMPGERVDAIAQLLPNLVKAEDKTGKAYPLYFDPAAYPPEKRYHANIILRR